MDLVKEETTEADQRQDERAAIQLTSSIPFIVALTGDACTGKSRLAKELAKSVGCALVNYDDIRGSFLPPPTEEPPCDISHRILWRMAFTELSNNFPSRVVMDSTLALPRDRVLEMKETYETEDILENPLLVLIVECKPNDESRRRQLLQEVQSQEMSCEVSDDFERNIHLLVVDTTDPHETANDLVKIIMKRIHGLLRRFDLDYFSEDETEEGDDPKKLHHVRHPRHYLYSIEAEEVLLGEGSIRCMLCQEDLSGPSFGCPKCRFYLHKSCAELPDEITVPYHEHTKFVLKQIGEIHPEQKCSVCNLSTGVLYKCERCFRVEVHLGCAQLPKTLKHPCHEHELILRIHTEPALRYVHLFMCCACGARGGQTSYFCEDCNHHFHVDCALRLEESVAHKCHWHQLILSSPPKDNTNEYYCEVCSQPRHPDFWIYYCKGCEYEAHVSCVNTRIGPYDPCVVEKSPSKHSGLIYLEEPEDYMEFGRYESYVSLMMSGMRVEY